MRALIAVVLVALFAVTMAADRSQFIEKWIKKGKAIAPDVKDIWNSGKNIAKDGKNIIDAGRRIRDKLRSQSDAEFLKKLIKKVAPIVKKAVPIVKKGLAIYAKVKSGGILSDKQFEKIAKKIRSAAPKAKKAYGFVKKAHKAIKAIKAESQSDAEFLGKLKQWWDKKGKNLFEKAKDYYAKGKQIYDIIKPKKQEAAPEADAEFLGKLKQWWDKKGKNLFEKAKDYYAKGKQIYDIVKPKKQAETESDLFVGLLAGALAKKFLVKKGVELAGKAISKIGKKKGSKKQQALSDAQFLAKLKQWWNTKGKPMYEKGQKIFNKAKDYYAKGKQIYDIIKPKKQAEDVAPEADTDATFDCGMAYQNGSPLGVKQCVNVQGKPVVVETAVAFEKMNAAAKAAGITLQVNSGFRTQKEQEYLYNCYKTKKCNNGNLAARPGNSNHQNGKAMDISCSNPKVYDWMRNNASKFGFVRTVASENWHWELRNAKCNAFVSYTCK